MQPNNLLIIRLMLNQTEKPSCKHLDWAWSELNFDWIRRVVYTFCNLIKKTCETLIWFKNRNVLCETGKKWRMASGTSCCFCRIKCHNCHVILKLSFHSSTVNWSRTMSHQSTLYTLIHRWLVLARGMLVIPFLGFDLQKYIISAVLYM